MSALTIIGATPTMSSAKDAITRSADRIPALLAGMASQEEAMVAALVVINLSTAATRRLSNFCASGGDDVELEGINTEREQAREMARDLACALDAAYPYAAASIRNALNAASYAEATLVPAAAYMCADIPHRACVVTYVVLNPLTGLLKIGRTRNLESRLSSLATGAGCPLEIVASIRGDIEGEMHARFKDIRVHGEWFKDDGRIRVFAAAQEAA